MKETLLTSGKWLIVGLLLLLLLIGILVATGLGRRRGTKVYLCRIWQTVGSPTWSVVPSTPLGAGFGRWSPVRQPIFTGSRHGGSGE